MANMENVLEILVPAIVCLGGLCYFWYSSKKEKMEVEKETDTDGELREYAVSLLANDKLESEVISSLSEQGCKLEDAKRIIEEAESLLEEKEKKMKRQYLMFGSLFFFGGILISVWSYINAYNGGTYIITWGAVLCGAFMLYKGMDL